MPSVTRIYSVSAVLNPGLALPAEQIPSPSIETPFGALTADNVSNCSIAVWLDSPPLGPPAFAIAPYSFKTLPLEARTVSLVVMAPNAQSAQGTIYVHLSLEKLAAAGGSSVPVSSVAVWDESRFDGDDVMGT
ncbi:MAG TPA: hypothetical protein VFB22_01195 [Candidatus Baltobacteraceae bacterium]|nr:hypothetical protein [Candidatus Baltobacteraceae bacterium]